MKVNVVGLGDGLATELIRDSVARFLDSECRKLNICQSPKGVLVDFSRNRDGILGVKKSLGSREDNGSPDFYQLVKKPRSNASMLRIQKDILEKIMIAASRYRLRDHVYTNWGLAQVDPHPRLSLNFVGPPGTGKTLAAHYLADQLEKNIIEVSYADVVSKYFGQAAKNLSELFDFAATMDALLFIDEAETLLSKRSAGGGEASDHAMNSMRSQLLILLERTPIVSVFASNMIKSYDQAFLSRILTVRFDLPDEETRSAIWSAHLPPALPLAPGVDAETLGKRYEGLSGREICRAIIEAAYRSAYNQKAYVDSEDIEWGVSYAKQVSEI